VITIRSGLNNQIEVSVLDFPDTAAIARSSQIKADLGFGDNVEFRVNNVKASGSLVDQDIIDIVAASHDKG